VSDERDAFALNVVPGGQRDAEDRAGGGPECTRPEGIGALRRQGDTRAEGVRRAQDRADVAGIADVPERDGDLPPLRRQVGSAEDADGARRMAERRDLREQLRLDVLAGNKELDGLDALRMRRLDEVLALDREETGLLAVLPSGEELADEPQLRVVLRGDQAAWELVPESSAAFALSAITANASGSDTAMSASDLRSSSMPAFRTPAMKRLYDSPLTRAAALILTIQSERNVRFLFFRSR
jgi:hypothetical protein